MCTNEDMSLCQCIASKWIESWPFLKLKIIILKLPNNSNVCVYRWGRVSVNGQYKKQPYNSNVLCVQMRMSAGAVSRPVFPSLSVWTHLAATGVSVQRATVYIRMDTAVKVIKPRLQSCVLSSIKMSIDDFDLKIYSMFCGNNS